MTIKTREKAIMLMAGLFLLNDLIFNLSIPLEFIKYYVSFGLLCELIFETYLAKKINPAFVFPIIVILFCIWNPSF